MEELKVKLVKSDDVVFQGSDEEATRYAQIFGRIYPVPLSEGLRGRTRGGNVDKG